MRLNETRRRLSPMERRKLQRQANQAIVLLALLTTILVAALFLAGD